MRKPVRVALWLFVAMLFAWPGAYHLEMRAWRLPHLDVQARQGDAPGQTGGAAIDVEPGGTIINGANIDEKTIQLEDELNQQIDRENVEHQNDFTWAFYADVAAVVSALLAAVLEALPFKKSREPEGANDPQQTKDSGGQRHAPNEAYDRPYAEADNRDDNREDSEIERSATRDHE